MNRVEYKFYWDVPRKKVLFAGYYEGYAPDGVYYRKWHSNRPNWLNRFVDLKVLKLYEKWVDHPTTNPE